MLGKFYTAQRSPNHKKNYNNTLVNTLPVMQFHNELTNIEISPSEQFADLIGSLSWLEEPLEYQQRLREENLRRNFDFGSITHAP